MIATLKKNWAKISLAISLALNFLMGLGWLDSDTHAWLTELLGHVGTMPQ